MPRMYLLVLFVATLQTLNVTPARHTLRYFITASSQITKLPEYWEVAYVDGVQISHFDSNSRKTKAKLDWVNKIATEDPDFWERELRGSIGNEQVFKVSLEIAKERFNQTGGVHMIQVMNGCEWDDETGEVDGWDQHRYDGEDFISFEWKTMRWIAANPQAFITKNKWERSDGIKEYSKRYVTEICPAVLKTYVSNGRDFLMRTGAVAAHTLSSSQPFSSSVHRPRTLLLSFTLSSCSLPVVLSHLLGALPSCPRLPFPSLSHAFPPSLS
ncbi:H-2 class I histocompatibility antigen, K-B alpha chain-like [Hippocampus comes]|uniref:H-2 class I histocompatibility antigen, K-B alpha chain-like n=1 Tax=Hippocampus comes TaxID=109280 RepID=UPI00094EA8AB|nr:PREDICTED: H-2 class I histocompatibility antigen, K-B alpha chain-like [Hippocampus comes]